MRMTLLITALLVLGSPAQATEAPTHRAELLAWSADGTAALVSEVSTSPTGGVRALRLLSKSGARRVVLSQIVLGKGKTPQKVSDRTCIQRVKSMLKTLERRGISGVTLDTTCAERSKLISVRDASAVQTADTWLSGEGLNLSRDGLSVSLKDNALTIAHQGAPVARWDNEPQALQLRAALSPTKRLLVILYGWGTGNLRIMKVMASKDGQLSGLKATRI